MARNNNRGLEVFDKVKQNSAASANTMKTINIKDEDLLDYPFNEEDLSNTEDLELSMEQLGFTDPLDVTDFGMEKGKYMILSGHRRRVAGRKKGIKRFPCMVHTFENQDDMENYIENFNLMMNATRDSSKDPLLMVTRCKKHENYLKKTNFKGSIREEIAKRTGLSVRSVERYLNFNSIIEPFWPLVREEVVGISSILPLYKHTEEVQERAYNLFKQGIEKEMSLNRDVCKQIINAAEEGITDIEDVFKTEDVPSAPEETKNFSDGVSVINVNTEPADSKEDHNDNPLRTNEVNYDYSHRDEYPDSEEEERPEFVPDDEEHEEVEEKEHSPALPKQQVVAASILKTMERLEDYLAEEYDFDESAEVGVEKMKQLTFLLMNEMKQTAKNVKGSEQFINKLMEDIQKELDAVKASY